MLEVIRSNFQKVGIVASLCWMPQSFGCSSPGPQPPILDEGDNQTALATTVECNPLKQLSWIHTSRMYADGGRVQLRIGTMTPTSGAIRGDILYLHGFADRLDNHKPLFEEWNRAGFRVISFDYPSHGETCGKSINSYSIDGLAVLAKEVEAKTIDDPKRPLFLAGWSTGGLVSIRALQMHDQSFFSRKIEGAVAFTPAVSVPLVIGEFGFVTEATLTRNSKPPHEAGPSPKSPAFVPLFAAHLLSATKSAKVDPLPKNIPILALVGGEREDRYANTAAVKTWIAEQKHLGANITDVSFDGGFHELDNEPEPMGSDVRKLSARYFSSLAL